MKSINRVAELRRQTAIAAAKFVSRDLDAEDRARAATECAEATDAVQAALDHRDALELKRHKLAVEAHQLRDAGDEDAALAIFARVRALGDEVFAAHDAVRAART